MSKKDFFKKFKSGVVIENGTVYDVAKLVKRYRITRTTKRKYPINTTTGDKMNKFYLSSRSVNNLQESHRLLRILANMAIAATSHIDFGVVTGYRCKNDQNYAYYKNKSKVKFPNSKHNKTPSEAIDVLAYKNRKPTYDMKYYIYLAGLFDGLFEIALKMYREETNDLRDYVLRWGGNWDQDGELLTDQKFDDGMHFEIVRG
ncbi:MAG: M15 family metallopeptidase [PVC group bacterium]|nr:M15 family metallopeptidase [PVC group bacterium]